MMPPDNSDNHYRTADTALAAWLYSNGFEPVQIDPSNPFRIAFVFDNPDGKLDSFVRDFQMGRAEGNIVLFYRAYKKLIYRIKASTL